MTYKQKNNTQFAANTVLHYKDPWSPCACPAISFRSGDHQNWTQTHFNPSRAAASWCAAPLALRPRIMPVRIRLALHGCTNRPFYHIVVAPARFKRDGRHLEQVSTRTSTAGTHAGGSLATPTSGILTVQWRYAPC